MERASSWRPHRLNQEEAGTSREDNKETAAADQERQRVCQSSRVKKKWRH